MLLQNNVLSSSKSFLMNEIHFFGAEPFLVTNVPLCIESCMRAVPLPFSDTGSGLTVEVRPDLSPHVYPKPSHTLTRTHTHSRTHTLSHSHSHSHSHTHTHTHTHSHTHTLTHTRTHSHTHTLTHSHTHQDNGSPRIRVFDVMLATGRLGGARWPQNCVCYY